MPTIQERTTQPAGYAVNTSMAPVSSIVNTPAMPTPPTQANEPWSSLRSPLPGILADPDQVRQVYGRGIIVRRFWPLANATR